MTTASFTAKLGGLHLFSRKIQNHHTCPVSLLGRQCMARDSTHYCKAYSRSTSHHTMSPRSGNSPKTHIEARIRD